MKTQLNVYGMKIYLTAPAFCSGGMPGAQAGNAGQTKMNGIIFTDL